MCTLDCVTNNQDKHISSVSLKAFFILISLLFYTVPSYSQVGAIVGVIGGSIAIEKAGDEFRESVDHAYAAAYALLEKGDTIAENRLNQLDTILEDTVGRLIGKSESAVLAVIEQAKKDVEGLEQKIYKDLKKVIWELECSGTRWAIADLGKAFGGLGEILGTNQIRLTPPQRILEESEWYTGCFWWCRDPYLVDITEPFGATYIRVRDLMEGSIASEHVSDTTPANYLVGTYEYLSGLALKASCFYQGSEDRYNREYVYYREKAIQWKNLVDIPLQ